MWNKKGFAIPEFLLAIILAAPLFVSFFLAFNTVISCFRNLMEMRTATLLLQEEISDVRDLKFSEIEALGTSFTLSNMALLKTCTGALQKNTYNAGGKVLKMTFKVNWQSFDNAAKEKKIVTLMTVTILPF